MRLLRRVTQTRLTFGLGWCAALAAGYDPHMATDTKRRREQSQFGGLKRAKQQEKWVEELAQRVAEAEVTIPRSDSGEFDLREVVPRGASKSRRR